MKVKHLVLAASILPLVFAFQNCAPGFESSKLALSSQSLIREAVPGEPARTDERGPGSGLGAPDTTPGSSIGNTTGDMPDGSKDPGTPVTQPNPPCATVASPECFGFDPALYWSSAKAGGTGIPAGTVLKQPMTNGTVGFYYDDRQGLTTIRSNSSEVVLDGYDLSSLGHWHVDINIKRLTIRNSLFGGVGRLGWWGNNAAADTVVIENCEFRNRLIRVINIDKVDSLVIRNSKFTDAPVEIGYGFRGYYVEWLAGPVTLQNNLFTITKATNVPVLSFPDVRANVVISDSLFEAPMHTTVSFRRPAGVLQPQTNLTISGNSFVKTKLLVDFPQKTTAFTYNVFSSTEQAATFAIEPVEFVWTGNLDITSNKLIEKP